MKALLISLMTVAVFAAACGGSSSSQQKKHATPTPTLTPTATPTASMVPGQGLLEGFSIMN
jgi:hypothetical protein